MPKFFDDTFAKRANETGGTLTTRLLSQGTKTVTFTDDCAVYDYPDYDTEDRDENVLPKVTPIVIPLEQYHINVRAEQQLQEGDKTRCEKRLDSGRQVLKQNLIHLQEEMSRDQLFQYNSLDHSIQDHTYGVQCSCVGLCCCLIGYALGFCCKP